MAVNWRLAVGVLGSLMMAVVGSSCMAAGVSVSDKAPNWAGLPGVDGKNHSLSDYKEAKVIVLVFTCNHCPVAQAYQDRLIALQKDFKARGVEVVAVNVNTIPADRLDKMKEVAKKKHFNFPYLYDASQKSGREYGARVTPHVFVLDQDRKIAFIGPVDDNQNEKKVVTKYVRNAVEALLDGKQPPDTNVPPVGCSIKYN